MDLANERLHAAAKSGDVEQLQVTWSDQVIPRRAADARSSGRAAVAQLWLGTGAELTHQDGYGAPVARVDDLRMWLVVSFCSAALAHRHTQWASLITGLV